jgi:hypothetical protein
MQVRIYRPAKNAMQSGPNGNAGAWILEYEPAAPRLPDRLMGWLGSADTRQQVRLRFPSRELAIAYAERRGLDYDAAGEPGKAFRAKNYADNFRYDKLEFGRF